MRTAKVQVIGYRGERTKRTLYEGESVTLTAGGYEPGTLTAIRDSNGDEIARLTERGWYGAQGIAPLRWDDLVIVAVET